MPVPGFLASIADKAQSAISSTPLAAHLPSHNRPNSPDSSSQPPANAAAAQGGHKSHTLENISHQFRTLGQQYSSTTTPAQKIITSEKGVALHFDSVGRDSKAQSKELYTWGQTEAEDLKDVTDRLAYLNFVQGTLTTTLAAKLDAARAPFKSLRDAETAIASRRTIRTNLQNQIARLEHDVQKSQDRKLLDLREQLRKAEMEDAGQEHEIEVLKRKAVKESERLKWEAIREYGEKLVLLSQAAPPIITVLPSVPPLPNTPIPVPKQPLAASELSRSDTRSFGESHAHELSALAAASPMPTPYSPMPTPSSPMPASSSPMPTSMSLQHSPAPAPRPMTQDASHHSPMPTSMSPQHSPAPAPRPVAQDASHQSPVIDYTALNNSPAPIPNPSKPPLTSDPSQGPPATPTIAETGIPVVTGSTGPGPASGSLRDLHPSPSARPASQSSPASRHETAEEEKRRLGNTYSASGAGQSQPQQAPPAAYESAEEEKQRLEREERERLLHQGSGQPHQDKQGGDDDLPPYQDI